MIKSKNIVQFPYKPKTFTSNEEVVDEVRNYIFSCGKTYDQIAAEASVAKSTVASLASGKTRWPRHTTLFPVMKAVGCGLMVVSMTRRAK